MSARYSINVYDVDTDEILKTLESRGLQWGQLVDIYDTVSECDDFESNFEAVEDLMLSIFPTATKEDIRGCYVDDMFSVIQQVMALGQKNGLMAQKKGKKAKN